VECSQNPEERVLAPKVLQDDLGRTSWWDSRGTCQSGRNTEVLACFRCHVNVIYPERSYFTAYLHNEEQVTQAKTVPAGILGASTCPRPAL
jgi:hypothetical protein